MDKNIIIAVITGIFMIISAIIGIFNYDISKTNDGILEQNELLIEENSLLKEELAKIKEETQSSTEMSTLPNTDLHTGWIKDDNGWMYKCDDGSHYIGWLFDYGSWYYFGDDCYMQTGWVTRDHINYYYCDTKTGAMLTNQITPDGYWVNENGLRQEAKNDIPSTTNETTPVENIMEEKVSIFTMDTFQGKAFWFSRSDSVLVKEDFIDTYGNEYLTAYVANHGPRTKEDFTSPTYLLDSKYKQLRGQFAWAKSDKNLDGSIWIEFYSGDQFIYQTEAITATDRAVSFEFSVEGLETITMVRNGTNRISVLAVYPYLDLIQ